MTGLHHTIHRTVLPQQVPDAEVLPPAGWPAYGLAPTGLDPLPDIVAYSSVRNTLFVIEVVEDGNAPSAARRRALLLWSSAYNGPCVFVWAYTSRRVYAENMGELLADTVVWFADEPAHHLYISGSPEASEEILTARFAAKEVASSGT
jgi:hypothetical protein